MDLKVIEARAGRAAKGAGVLRSRILAGLVDTWHQCWAEKCERLTVSQLAGIFGRKRLAEIIDSLIHQEFLCPLACVCTRCMDAKPVEGGHRVGGAHKFVRLREAFAEGGRKTQAGRSPRASPKASLKAQPSGQSPDPEIPRSRDPESVASLPPEKPRSRDPETDSGAFAEYWIDLEGARQGHCRRLGVEPKGACRCKPERQATLIADALAALDLTDAPVEAWRGRLDELLGVFFDDEQLGLEDRDGKERDQPWPLPVFLNPKILARLARDVDERVTQ